LASIDRTAYPRFKRVISARELAESFTPAPGEVEWARGRTQNDQHFLALVVRLKCYQRLGYFPKLAEVPVMVVDHVCGKLELARDVAAVADAERTGKRHRQFVRDRLGVKYAPAAVREVAETAIRTAVQCKDNPAETRHGIPLGAITRVWRAGAVGFAGTLGKRGVPVVIAEKQRISLTCGAAAWTADQPSRTTRSATASARRAAGR
jgi:Domain of unknown function (DUF4158)